MQILFKVFEPRLWPWSRVGKKIIVEITNQYFSISMKKSLKMYYAPAQMICNHYFAKNSM